MFYHSFFKFEGDISFNCFCFYFFVFFLKNTVCFPVEEYALDIKLAVKHNFWLYNLFSRVIILPNSTSMVYVSCIHLKIQKNKKINILMSYFLYFQVILVWTQKLYMIISHWAQMNQTTSMKRNPPLKYWNVEILIVNFRKLKSFVI